MSKPLATTLVAALAVDTIGAVSPFGGKTYLPPPSRYVATWTLWFVLGLIAAVGPRAARAAAQLSVLVLLSKLVIGGAGGKVVALFNGVGRFFPAQGGTT